MESLSVTRSMWWPVTKAYLRAEKKRRKGRRNRLKGAPGRGTLEKEKPPIFGMIQRGGQVVIHMLENVRQVTIQPLIQATIAPGTLVLTDEYDIYYRLPQWGYAPQDRLPQRGGVRPR